MKLNGKVNYLNSNELISLIDKFRLQDIPKISKLELIKILKRKNLINQQIKDAIYNFPNRKTKSIDCKKFHYEIIKSKRLKDLFSERKIKGFSFVFKKSFSGYPHRLSSSVNLRYAMFYDDDLYYPQRIKKTLTKYNQNHLFLNGSPAIAFACGKMINQNLYVLTLQTDLPLYKLSFLNNHFKDWRKLLFSLILDNNKINTKNIYLCPSDKVKYTCYDKIGTPIHTPNSWKYIYDNTAKFFDMKLCQTEREIDIQLYSKRGQIPNQIFYRYTCHTEDET